VHVRSTFGKNDLGSGADDGARKLDKDTGMRSALGIAEMASIVEPDRDDFARLGWGEQFGARERRRLSSRLATEKRRAIELADLVAIDLAVLRSSVMSVADIFRDLRLGGECSGECADDRQSAKSFHEIAGLQDLQERMRKTTIRGMM